jgi:hypothetical protein
LHSLSLRNFGAISAPRFSPEPVPTDGTPSPNSAQPQITFDVPAAKAPPAASASGAADKTVVEQVEGKNDFSKAGEVPAQLFIIVRNLKP